MELILSFELAGLVKENRVARRMGEGSGDRHKCVNV